MEKIMKVVFRLSACTTVLAVALICLFLFSGGIAPIREIGLHNFLLGTVWKPSVGLYGIFPMILSSVIVTALALMAGIPLGLMTAVYLSFYAKKKVKRVLEGIVNLLAGIPSVVYGFFGLMVITPIFGSSIISASILLGIMIIPTICSLSQAALQAVPSGYYEGALALGTDKETTIFKVMLPAAKSGITASVVLGIGRAIGETMAVIMVAGNQPVLPRALNQGIRTMTANIVLEMGYATDLHRGALIATAVILFIFILIVNFTFNLIKNKKSV